MFRSKSNKEENRYYLLPGMGRSNRRHHVLMFRWAVVVGLLISCIFGALLYFFHRHSL